VQVDPIKSTLKAPRAKRLKLECDDLLSKFAFKFNLRRYIKGRVSVLQDDMERGNSAGSKELAGLRAEIDKLFGRAEGGTAAAIAAAAVAGVETGGSGGGGGGGGGAEGAMLASLLGQVASLVRRCRLSL